MLAPAFVCSHNQQRKTIPGQRRPPFSLCSAGLRACHSAATSLLLGGTYSPPRRAPVTQAGGSRQALPLGGCLAWKERRSDSPATKIRPFRYLEKRLATPPLPTHTHTHPSSPALPPTRLAPSARDAQSQKEQSARVQARSYGLSAPICRTGVRWLGRRSGGGGGGGGARVKPWF